MMICAAPIHCRAGMDAKRQLQAVFVELGIEIDAAGA